MTRIHMGTQNRHVNGRSAWDALYEYHPVTVGRYTVILFLNLIRCFTFHMPYRRMTLYHYTVKMTVLLKIEEPTSMPAPNFFLRIRASVSAGLEPCLFYASNTDIRSSDLETRPNHHRTADTDAYILPKQSNATR
jgi:hypothetical protein